MWLSELHERIEERTQTKTTLLPACLKNRISFRRVERKEPIGSMQDGMLPKFNGTIFLNATNVEVGFISLGRNKKCHVEALFGD